MGPQKTKGKSRSKAARDIDWVQATHRVPVCPVFEDLDLSSIDGVEEALDAFLSTLEGDQYLVWEGVIREEQGLPLTARQEDLLDELLDFGDEDGDRILSINEHERPTRPWYEDLRELAPNLLSLPIHSDGADHEVQFDGWRRIAEALEDHGEGLSLPTGVAEPLEVVPADLRHQLWIQTCCEVLMGIGDHEAATSSLRSPNEQDRVDELVELLEEHRDSVEALGLTLQRLREYLVLPGEEQGLFEDLLTKALDLPSLTAPLAAGL